MREFASLSGERMLEVLTVIRKQTGRPQSDRSGKVRTSIWLPKDVVRDAKVRAAFEGRFLADVTADALRAYVAQKRHREGKV